MIIDETRGCSKHETEILIAIWGEISLLSIGIITDVISIMYAYSPDLDVIYICIVETHVQEVKYPYMNGS